MTAFEHVETLNRSGADIPAPGSSSAVDCSAKPFAKRRGQLEEVAYRPLVTVYIQSWSN